MGSSIRFFLLTCVLGVSVVGTDARWLHAADVDPPQRAVVIPMEGMITSMTGAFMTRKLSQARQLNSQVIIVDIDSLGGDADVSFQIAKQLRAVDWAITIAYIEKEAISGAAIVAMGCDKIIMHDGAMIGDAGVILGNVLEWQFKYAPEKVLSKYVAEIRQVADAGGRPAAIAEAMMDKDAKVLQATNRKDGRVWYFTDEELESLADAEDWEPGKPVFEARDNTFLTISGKRAVELKMANGLVDSPQQLFKDLNVAGEPRVLARTGVDTAVWVLNLSVVTFLLFVIGLLALFVEFSAPGMGVGGLVATLCFGLFFWSRFLGGTAGWLEVTLFVVGLIFILCEIFVIPGFGVAGISGLLLVSGSLVLASQDAVWPVTNSDLSTLNTTLATVGGAIVAFVILAVVTSRYMLDLPGLNRLALAPQAAAVGGERIEAVPPWDLVDVGDLGVAGSPLRPSGKVDFGHTVVDVVTEGDFVDSGTEVRVVQKQGTRVVVRAVT